MNKEQILEFIKIQITIYKEKESVAKSFENYEKALVYQSKHNALEDILFLFKNE